MSFIINNKQALPDSEFEIEGEIKSEILESLRPEVLKSLGENVKIDGFRPGHIPEKVLIDKFGEVYITEEAGQLALERHYTDIIKETGIIAMGSPEVTITKVAPKENFGFKIRVAVMPEVTLGDYKKIAKETPEKEASEVSDKEIEESIDELRKQIAHSNYHKEHPDDHDHNHGDLPLPEVDTDFIKNYGEFASVEEFKEKVKESLQKEKDRKAKEARRLSIMDSIVDKTEVNMPKMLTESELNKMLGEMNGNIEQMGLKMDEYLKHINKTIDDLKTEWRPDAEKRAKIQLILNKIAVIENIDVDKEQVNKEVEAILKYYKDADRVRVEMYVESMLLNEAVWKFLEEVK